MNVDSQKLLSVIIAIVSAMLLSTTVVSQEFGIIQISRGASGEAVIQHTSDPAYYYILYRGTNVTQIVSAAETASVADIALGVSAEGHSQLVDPPTPSATSFYRVGQVSISQPLDTDGDSIDDVWELRYRRRGAALNPDDGNEDHTSSGSPDLVDYQLPVASFAQPGSTVFASNGVTVPVQVNFSKPFAGEVILLTGGNAVHGQDFTIAGHRPSDQTARVTSSSASTTAMFTVTLKDAPGIAPDRYVVLSIVQSGTNATSQYSARDPDSITHTLRITEGDLGVYVGTLELTNRFGLESHPLSFALRSGSGNTAMGYLDATQSPLFRRAFMFPVTTSLAGEPLAFDEVQYQTNADALGRTLSVSLKFGPLTNLSNRLEIPATNKLSGLSASGKVITRTGVMRLVRIASPQ